MSDVVTASIRNVRPRGSSVDGLNYTFAGLPNHYPTYTYDKAVLAECWKVNSGTAPFTAR